MHHFLDVIEPSKTQKDRGLVGLILFQSDYAKSIDTMLLIPCRAFAANLDLGKITPKFEMDGKIILAVVPQMAGVRRSDVSSKIIGSAAAIRDDLVQALDLLVTGF